MTSPTALDSFESALLAELRQHVADSPARRSRPPRRVRRLLVGAVAAGLAASVVVVVGVGGHGGASPAYAVELDGDGDVVVTVHRLDDAAGLEAALRAKGIDADVSYDPDGTTAMGVGPDGEMLRDDDVPPPVPSPGDDGPAAGSTQRDEGGDEEPELGTDGPGAGEGRPADDFCRLGADPAELTRRGDDWVLRIPAGSPLMDRQVMIGTDALGGLSVFYAGDQPGSFCGLVQHGAAPPR